MSSDDASPSVGEGLRRQSLGGGSQTEGDGGNRESLGESLGPVGGVSIVTLVVGGRASRRERSRVNHCLLCCVSNGHVFAR